MATKLRVLPLLVLLCVCSLSCFFSRRNSVPPEVRAAMERAGDLNATFPALSASGSMADIWTTLPQTFPELQVLIDGQKDTPSALLEPFRGSATIEADMRLAIYARALEARGERSAVGTLQEFLGANVTGELVIAPHFVTRALYSLAGRTEPSDGAGWYFTSQMRSAAAGAYALRSSASALSQRPSCGRRYLLVDANGKALEYYENGVRKKAVVGGTEFASPWVPEATAEGYREKVSSGGGQYVDGSTATDDAGFVGSPSKQFNCAGYAFRKFNDNRLWTADPSKWWRVLVGTSSLQIVSQDDQIQPGDIVFYFSPDAKAPGHVAPVKEVTTGLLGTITVRNADGQSGLWEASIDAAYFFAKDTTTGKPRNYGRREVYRWTNGAPPKFIPDPDYASDPDNCANGVTGADAGVDKGADKGAGDGPASTPDSGACPACGALCPQEGNPEYRCSDPDEACVAGSCDLQCCWPDETSCTKTVVPHSILRVGSGEYLYCGCEDAFQSVRDKCCNKLLRCDPK